jgi:hypothetical protein
MSTRVASSPTVCKTVPHHRAPGHKFPSFGKAGLNLVGGLPPSAAKKSNSSPSIQPAFSEPMPENRVASLPARTSASRTGGSGPRWPSRGSRRPRTRSSRNSRSPTCAQDRPPAVSTRRSGSTRGRPGAGWRSGRVVRPRRQPGLAERADPADDTIRQSSTTLAPGCAVPKFSAAAKLVFGPADAALPFRPEAQSITSAEPGRRLHRWSQTSRGLCC